MKNNNRRWSIWITLVMAFITVFFHRLAISVVADDLIRDFNLTGKGIGNLTAMTFYAYALMQIPVGIMVDTIGVRKICTLGTILTGIGSILFGLATSIPIAYVARFIVGIGTSVIIVSIIKVQIIWFKKEQFSTLSGLTSLAGNMGALLATFPLAYIVVVVGWRNSFHIMGIASLIMALVIWAVVKDAPEDAITDNSKKIPIWKGIKSVLSNPYTWPPFAIMLFFVGSMTAILGLWGVPYLMHVYGLTKSQAAGYLSFVAIGFMVVAPLVGVISDALRGEIKRILILATAVFTSIWAYLAYMGGQPPIGQLPYLFFLMGASVICHILVFTNVKEVNNPAFSGSSAAIINVGEFVGGSLISFFIGWYLDLGWKGGFMQGGRAYQPHQYRDVFILLTIIGFASFVSALLIKGKDKKVEKVKHGKEATI